MRQPYRETDPLVSVIMGIYNCEDTLAEALNCLIGQTYTNWEIILCDDGSHDHTAEIAQGFVDRYPGKIHLLRNEKNLGLNVTLNKCLEKAQGELIARMDGDDLCSPDRFEKEVSALFEHPEMSIVSTDMQFFDEDGIWGRTRVKQFPKPIDFMGPNPFCHAPCMVRKEAYEAVDGYSVAKKLLRVEDYHLWVKMYEKGYRGMNIQEPLYQMRDDRNATSRKKFRYRLNAAYVEGYAIKHLNLPPYYYLRCIRPILVGLLPGKIYSWLHHAKRKNRR